MLFYHTDVESSPVPGCCSVNINIQWPEIISGTLNNYSCYFAHEREIQGYGWGEDASTVCRSCTANVPI